MKNKFVIGAVVVALVLSVLAVTNQPTQTVVEKVVERVIGAIPGDSLDGNQFSVGGVKTFYFSSGLRPASSTSLTANTMCSFKVLATSTLVAATLKVDANEAYANTFEIGIGTTPYATTTRLGIKTIAASVPGEVIASTTDSVTGLSGNVLIPNRYINFNVATGTPSDSFNPTGKCVVQYREI